jgi:hypothetical protein
MQRTGRSQDRERARVELRYLLAALTWLALLKCSAFAGSRLHDHLERVFA